MCKLDFISQNKLQYPSMPGEILFRAPNTIIFDHGEISNPIFDYIRDINKNLGIPTSKQIIELLPEIQRINPIVINKDNWHFVSGKLTRMILTQRPFLNSVFVGYDPKPGKNGIYHTVLIDKKRPDAVPMGMVLRERGFSINKEEMIFGRGFEEFVMFYSKTNHYRKKDPDRPFHCTANGFEPVKWHDVHIPAHPDRMFYRPLKLPRSNW